MYRAPQVSSGDVEAFTLATFVEQKPEMQQDLPSVQTPPFTGVQCVPEWHLCLNNVQTHTAKVPLPPLDSSHTYDVLCATATPPPPRWFTSSSAPGLTFCGGDFHTFFSTPPTCLLFMEGRKSSLSHFHSLCKQNRILDFPWFRGCEQMNQQPLNPILTRFLVSPF